MITTRTITWVPDAHGSLWDVDNLPYGIFSRGADPGRVGVRVGHCVLDLVGAYPGLAALFDRDALNPFFDAGPQQWAQVRSKLVRELCDENFRARLEPHFHRTQDVTMHLPIVVADYVDFYASLNHATTVGRIFRPDGAALNQNWRHLPVGYHGRSGTVVVSGTPVVRPCGQSAPDQPGELPNFGPSTRLDIEAELGFVVGTPSTLTVPVGVDSAEQHVFGVVGLNDWSARDIQAWEYVPLGPFLGKSFATSISAWVTPMAALAHARVPLPDQDPQPLPYLRAPAQAGFDVEVEVEINGEVVLRPPFRSMYWSVAQFIAHLTANGASLRAGDLLGSGTISGSEMHECGSFLERSWGGTRPWSVGGSSRTYLDDGDEVLLRYSAPGVFGRIGLGEVHAKVLPALIPPDRGQPM